MLVEILIPAPALGEDESNELIILYEKYEILKIIYIIDESNDNFMGLIPQSPKI